MSEDQQADWKCRGWSDHELGALEAGRKLSFRERLEWLEEISQLVAHMEATRTRNRVSRVEEPPPPPA